MGINDVDIEDLDINRETQSKRNKERKSVHPGEAWRVYGGDYDATFHNLLEGHSIIDVMEQRPLGKRRILDLMGPGEIVRNLNAQLAKRAAKRIGIIRKSFSPLFRRPQPAIFVDGGIGVTLVDPYKDPQQQEENRRLNLHVIEADFYDPNTIQTVKTEMQKADFAAFDIIVCRPEGPFMNFPDINEKRVNYQRIFFNLLAQYSGLLVEGGILLTQVPYKLIRNQYLGDGKWQVNFRNEYDNMLKNFCRDNELIYQLAPQGNIWGEKERDDVIALKLEKKPKKQLNT